MAGRQPRWIFDDQGNPSFYLVGQTIADPSGQAMFHVIGSQIYPCDGGPAIYWIGGDWFYEHATGLPAYYLGKEV
jgi:protocatechuate 3,4-dioxygenase beta subunit